MSVRHMGLVLDRLDAPPQVKLIAVILADHADADGYCWPSYGTIAERSCLAERTVRRYVHELLHAGIVTKVRSGKITTRDGQVLRLSNAYRMSEEALSSLPSLLSAGVAASGQMAASGQDAVAVSGRGRGSQAATKPSGEPSLSEEHSLSETGVPDARSEAPKVSAKKDADWQERAEAVLAATAFPALYRELAELLAEANRTGRAALSRVVRELYEPLLEVERDVGAEAMRVGLRAATSRAAPNANYVRKAAEGHARRPASVAVTSRGIDRSDYDDFCTGGEL